MAKIITAAIIKGGTGKTATCAALAQAAAADRKKVLAIDLDPQANLTFSLGASQNQPGSYQMLSGNQYMLQSTKQGIDVIAASPDLSAIKTSTASAKRLQKALAPLQGEYDLVVIDTPPQMGELTYNAIQASTGLIIPLEADSSSLQGMYHITDIAAQMQQSNPELNILGALITRYDGRAKINKYIRGVIMEKAAEAGIPYLGEIRSGIAIKEAAAMQESLFDYAKGSKPAQDYKALYAAIMG